MAKIDRQPAGGGGATLPINESDVTGLVTDLAAKADAMATSAALSGKAATVHSHAEGDVTSLVADLASKAASSHTHTEANVTNLVADLAAKAAASHTHAEADVTSLVADLAARQPLDADLTAIAGLSPTVNDVLQFKAGAWANRTIAQLIVDLVAQATAFKDNLFSIVDDVDNTKVGKFNLSDVATGQTRTYDLPDASGDMISFPFGRPVNRGEIPAVTAFGQGVLGLGGADQVMRSDGTDAGYALHTAGAPIPRSGFWYEPGFGSIGGGFAPAVSSGTYLPIVFSKSGTIDALAVEVVTGGATSTVRLGVYDDGGIGVPTNRLVDAGTVATTASATVVSITGLSVPVVAWRIYYLAVFAQGGTPPTVRNNSGPSPYMPTGNSTPGTGTTRPSGFSQSSVAGALPATATPVLVNSSNGVIRAWCRFA